MRTLIILFLCLIVHSCDSRQKRLEEVKTALDDESADLIEIFAGHDDEGKYHINEDALKVVELYSTDTCSYYFEEAVRFTEIIAFNPEDERERLANYPALMKYEVEDRRRIVAYMINTLQPIYEKFNPLCVTMPGYGLPDAYDIGIIDCFWNICFNDRELIKEIEANHCYGLPHLTELIEKMRRDERFINKDTGALEPWLFSPQDYTAGSLIEPDRTLFPEDEEAEIDILLPAGYRDSQLSDFDHMYSEAWYDFYQGADSSFYMNEATIKLENFYDGCIGDSVPSVSSGRENSIVLIKGIVPQDSLMETKPMPGTIFVGVEYEFEFHNQKYLLRGDGVLDDDKESNDGWNAVKNYKLYLSKAGADEEQLLIAMPEFQDTCVELLWMGDMDLDGRPDFIFDVSGDYESKAVVLFLSSKADEGSLVKCVGRSEYVFDC
ncbi:hypothetical protein [Bacteroides sp.]|uniref:hypothetical protein n=1 Tax=Bacteroides sp. TaxID=29523 RepID=UPI003AB637D7